jgi:LysW-gamma-L-lysine carboxypeptidase
VSLPSIRSLMVATRMSEQVDPAQAEGLLAGLVERYSPSQEEGPAVVYLVEQMEALGFRARVDEAGNAVGELGEGHEAVLLLGHIDTVPGQIQVHQRGRQLYGRGSVDAKGSLASFVVSAANAWSACSRRIIVVGAVEEEAATSKGARHLLDYLAPPSAVVIGEPSGWDHLTVGYKGRLLVDYQLAQPVGHTAGPDQSVCETAVSFWQQVVAYAQEWNQDRQRMFDQVLPSLRAINSDSDGFAERVEATIGLRLPPEVDIDALEQRLARWAGVAQLSCRGREEAYRASKSTFLARAFIKAVRSAGGKARFQVKSGTSDMNVVGPVWQCPILAYGPGDAALDHTPHEHLDFDEYQRAIRVLTSMLADL